MVLVLAFAAVLAWCGNLLRPEAWLQSESKSDLDRDLYYALDPDMPPLRLKVQPGATELKLSMHVVLGSDAPLDPEYVVPYCLDARLVDSSNETRWSRRMCYESARAGALEPPEPGKPGPGRRVERSWLRDLPGRLTDPRNEQLDLGILGGDAGVLELSAVEGVGSSILVRPYRLERMPEYQAGMRARGLPASQRQRMAEEAGVANWEQLDPLERRLLVGQSWLRQEAIGARGVDYQPVTVLTRDLPQADSKTALSGWIPLGPGRGLALNLRGPTWARVQINGSSPVEVATNYQHSIGHREVLGPSRALVEQVVRIDKPEVSSLTLVNQGEEQVHVRVLCPDVPQGLFANTRAANDPESGLFALDADRSTSRLSYAEPGQPVEFDLGLSNPDRMRMRFRQAGDAPLDGTIIVFDERGDEMFRSEVHGEFEPSPFERVQRNIPGARYHGTSEMLRRESWLPSGAVTVRFEANEPVFLRAQVPVSDEWLPTKARTDYRLDTQGVILRYDPLAEWNWQSLTPDHEYLPNAQGRWARFTAQVRLEPSNDSERFGPASMSWSSEVRAERSRGVAWRPEGEVRRMRIFEAVPAEAEPRDGDWSLLPPGKERRVQIEERGTAIRIWSLDGAAPGGKLPVYVDDKLMEFVDLGAGNIDRRLWSIPEGTHRVRVGEGGENLRVLLDAPSNDGGAQYRARTLYQLGSSDELELKLDIPEGMRISALLLPYFESGTKPSKRAQILYRVVSDSEVPRGYAFGRTTPERGRRSLELRDASVGFPTDDGLARIGRGEAVAARVYEDLGDRQVRVFFRRDPSGPPIWARFVVMGLAPQERPERGRGRVESAGAGEQLSWIDPYLDIESLDDVFDALQSDPHGEFVPAPVELLPAATRLARILMAVAETGSAATIEELGRETERFGFRLQALRVGARRYLLLHGAHGDGRSALLLGVGPDHRPILLQTPHAFADLQTGQIGLRLFEQGRLRAWQWNTRHRRSVAGDPNPTDLSHVQNTWFQAIMEGIAEEMEGGLVLQLHGYGRQTIPEKDVHVVLSGGAQGNHRALDCMAGIFGSGASLFGRDIDRLGGTTNVQGAALAQRVGPPFVHLESSPEQRQQWLNDPAALERLIEATLAGLGCATEPRP
jgi:hypothetical protein